MAYFHEIDILKGIAVICMIIFHIYYFPNQYGYKEFDYKTLPLQTIAKIAQLIFITCVGINLVLSNQKKDVYPWNRILNLVFFASCMSLFSYFIFESKYIKFGILHFISLGKYNFHNLARKSTAFGFNILGRKIWYLPILIPAFLKFDRYSFGIFFII